MNESTRDEIGSAAPPAWRIALVASLIFVGAALLLFATWRLGRPIELPNAAHEKLQCASYTPSNNGRMLDAAERRKLVARDLRLLASRFECVRTYSVSEGLDDVPRVAREIGLKVLLGLWISMDGPSNDREIAHGVELANQYADVVIGVIVGNEVLLRRELTGEQLRTLLERVKSATKVPITYADVWEFWLRNTELAKVADFVTIHILPYWEDNPIDIEHAVDHVQSIYKKVQGTFPDSKILIGETGWPSVGRPRLDAVPSLVNEARFVREFVAFAEREKIPYNLIEAFDQPWKRIQEGTVGGYWGLYDAHGNEKFAFTGAIIPDPTWRVAVLASVIGAVLFGILGWLSKPRPSFRALALLAVVGHIAGNIAVKQWFYVVTANRSVLEWTATSSWAFIGWVAVVCAALETARWIDGATPATSVGIARLFLGIGHGSSSPRHVTRTLGVTRFLMLFATAYVALGLCYEGRGRDFPLSLAILPVLAFVMLEFIARRDSDRSPAREELLLAFVLTATSIYVLASETFANTRAVIWSLLCVLFAGTIAVGRWRALHPDERAEQHADPAEFKRIED